MVILNVSLTAGFINKRFIIAGNIQRTLNFIFSLFYSAI